MTLSALQAAAVDALYAIPGLPRIVMPNRHDDGSVPRIEVAEGPVASTVTTMAGDEDATWILQIGIVADDNTGPQQMQAWVQSVSDAFRAGRRIGSGYVTQRPFPDAYIQDEAGYRAILTIRLRSVL